MLNPRFEQTPDSEMKRRQEAILAVMAEKDVDAIVMYSYSDMVAGTLKYAVDITHAYSLAAILCPEGIALFRNGNNTPYDADLPFVSKGEQLPQRIWTHIFLPGITYLTYCYAQAMDYFIKSRGFKRVGWTGYSFLPAPLCQYLIENNPTVEFVDFTAEVDEVRLVKSEWEIERFLRCVDLHDRLIMACRSLIRPRLTAHQLSVEIMDAAAQLGAVEFNTTLINHWRDDVTLDHDTPMLPGDYLWVLVEVAGVGGEWGECARLFRLGEEPEQKYVKICNDLIKIQDAVAAACKPGAIPEEVFLLNNKLLEEYGYNPERRICIHGQTYDIVDLPLFSEGDKKPLKENMFIAIHPAYYAVDGEYKKSPSFNNTDNYLIEKDGARLLSKTPREIITVGI